MDFITKFGYSYFEKIYIIYITRFLIEINALLYISKSPVQSSLIMDTYVFVTLLIKTFTPGNLITLSKRSRTGIRYPRYLVLIKMYEIYQYEIYIAMALIITWILLI